MYRKVLVPLDGSKLSECSLEHVKEIVKGCQIPEVILLVAVEPPEAEVFHNLMEKALVKAEDYLLRVASGLDEEGIAAKAEVVVGMPANVILDYTAQNHIDLIIMSTHGKSGSSRWLFGSAADKIIRNSAVPLLTVTLAGCGAKI